MRTFLPIIPAILLLVACGSLQETTHVRDDVYDIPDRTVVASRTPVEPAPAEEPAEKSTEDYYSPREADRYTPGSYYDRTYNDPYWYNSGRFGFGMSLNNWGPSYGMGLSYGWPGNNTMFNSPTGWYDPYWENSWQSGYGAWNNPYYNNYGYYSPWNQGYYDPYAYGYGYGYGNGYGPYQGPYGNCCTCYQPVGFGSSVIVSHRPSMSGGGSSNGAGIDVTPRNPVSLLRTDRPATRPPAERPSSERWNTKGSERPADRRPPAHRTNDNDRGRAHPEKANEHQRESRPSFNTGGSQDGGDRSGGGSSPSTSPRPRR